MEIKKVFNNNVILSEDDHGEVIVIGKGIGFGQKVGNDLSDEKIEKKYRLLTDDDNLHQLLSEISVPILEVTDQIVRLAKKSLDKPLNDFLLVSLADHLDGSVKQLKDGVHLANFLLWDIKRFFPQEFEIGLKGIELLKEELNLDFTEDDAGYIALHIVNAELDSRYASAQDLTQLMEELLTIVKYGLETPLDDQSIYVQRFYTHLNFFCQRVLSDQHEKMSENNEMLTLLKSSYPKAYETTLKIADYLKEQKNYEVSADEQLYLVIHLSRIAK